LSAGPSSLASVVTVSDGIAAAQPLVDHSYQLTCTSLPLTLPPTSQRRQERSDFHRDVTNELFTQLLPVSTNTLLPTDTNLLPSQQTSPSISDKDNQLSDHDSDSWFDVRSPPSLEASFESAFSESSEFDTSSISSDLDLDLHSHTMCIPTVIGFRPSQRKQNKTNIVVA